MTARSIVTRVTANRPDAGATLVEYALLVALIVVACLAAIGAVTSDGKEELTDRRATAGRPVEVVGALGGGPGGGGTGGADGGGEGSTVTATIGPANMSGFASDDGNKWIAQVTIVVSSSEGPVSGATVKGAWDAGGGNAETECTTDSAGACSVQRTKINDNTDSTTFTVSTVTSGDPQLVISYVAPSPPDARTVGCGDPIC